MRLKTGSWRALVVLAWGLSAPAVAMAAVQPAPQSLEYSVKANYLVRFAAFVGWPARAFAAPQSPVVICVVGHDPFDGALETAAADQTAYGRPLAVRRPRSREAAEACHILYVGQGSGGLVPDRSNPVLLVTDAAAPQAERGAIHFAISDNRVRFHIDLQQASRAGLSISSRLLNLALSVRGG